MDEILLNVRFTIKHFLLFLFDPIQFMQKMIFGNALQQPEILCLSSNHMKLKQILIVHL